MGRPKKEVKNDTVLIPDDVIGFKKTEDGGIQFELKPQEDKPVDTEAVYPKTNILLEKTKAEMEAGKQRVAFFEEQRRMNPPPMKSQKEAMAEGASSAVFRPNDFIEYAKNFKQQAMARSKDI